MNNGFHRAWGYDSMMMRMIRMMMKRMMRLTRVAVVRRGPVTDMRVSSAHSIHLH